MGGPRLKKPSKAQEKGRSSFTVKKTFDFLSICKVAFAVSKKLSGPSTDLSGPKHLLLRSLRCGLALRLGGAKSENEAMARLSALVNPLPNHSLSGSLDLGSRSALRTRSQAPSCLPPVCHDVESPWQPLWGQGQEK